MGHMRAPWVSWTRSNALFLACGLKKDQALQVPQIRQHESRVAAVDAGRGVTPLPRRDVIGDGAHDVGVDRHLAHVDRHATDRECLGIEEGIVVLRPHRHHRHIAWGLLC